MYRLFVYTKINNLFIEIYTGILDLTVNTISLEDLTDEPISYFFSLDL